jgi:hypothetical protein
LTNPKECVSDIVQAEFRVRLSNGTLLVPHVG